MNVFFYNFGDFCTPHLEIQHDVMQQHLDAGDEVTKLRCNGELPVCFVNPEHKVSFCVACIARNKAIAKLVSPTFKQRTWVNLSKADRALIKNFHFQGQTIEDLKQLQFGSFDIGMSVASLLIQKHRDSELEVLPIRSEINDWLGVTLAVYLSVKNTMRQENVDRVYVFNGRRSIYRAVFRACMETRREVHCLDGHQVLTRYTDYKNRINHDIQGTLNDIEKLWESADAETRKDVGNDFFNKQRSGQTVKNFVKLQEEAKLPSNWDATRRNIVFFQSSDFELAAISSEFDSELYTDQYEAISKIAESLGDTANDLHIYLRMHPHLSNDQFKPSVGKYLNLDSEKLTVIAPDSPVSSHALIQRTEKTVSFGSTMSIEAVMHNKPSILLAPTYFSALGSTYNPTSHGELMNMLQKELKPLPKEGALKYGYYMLKRGKSTKYLKRESMWTGMFKGRYVDENVSFWWSIGLLIVRSRLGPTVDKLGKLHRTWRKTQLSMRLSQND